VVGLEQKKKKKVRKYPDHFFTKGSASKVAQVRPSESTPFHDFECRKDFQSFKPPNILK